MSGSGPDDEVSLSVQLSETGVSGKVKGRTLAITQRWLGSMLAPHIARNERAAARERLIGSLERDVIKQIAPEALRQLISNPDAIDAVVAAAAPPGSFRKRENLGAVIVKTIEDLRLNPPSQAQQNVGSAEVEPEVADRLEQYASGATTEEVREKWGRVLAAEIRQPGTFSLKVLRIIDELDNKLPTMFEGFASDRLEQDIVPRCLSGKLDYDVQIALVDAGLIHDPGGSEAYQFRYYTQGTQLGPNGQEDVWVYNIELACVTIPREGAYGITEDGGQAPIMSHDGRPGLPNYLLTNAGQAITSILPPVDNAARYLTALRAKVPHARLWKRNSETSPWYEHDPLPTEPPAIDGEMV